MKMAGLPARSIPWLRFVSLTTLAIVAPFETLKPLLTIGPLQLTLPEMVLIIALVAVGIDCCRNPTPSLQMLTNSLTLPVLALGATILMAALTAETNSIEALKFGGRFA